MTHYQTLELPSNASASDIRQAYRRLVLLTHPDRTPDPAAHVRYLAINEAYETLSSLERRQAYDTQLTQPMPVNQAPRYSSGRSRDEQCRRYQWRPAPNAPPPAGASLHMHYAPLAKWINYACIAFGLLIAIDYCCAIDYTNEPILSTEYRVEHARRGGVTKEYYVFETPHASFHSIYSYKTGEILALRRSPLFGQVLGFRHAADSPADIYDNRDDTIYSPIGLLPGLMLITASVGAWPGRISRRQVECATMAAVLAVITVWLLTTL